jgi:hypothetical protein
MSEIKRPAQHTETDVVIHENDLNGIRSAAQWLLGAFGGVALVVVTAVQIGDASAVLSQGGWRAIVIVVGLLTVFFSLVILARSAARVLVPDRTNLTDLIEDQAIEEAQQHGVIVNGSKRRDSAQVYKYVREEISRARGWLLPPGCDDLDAAYQAYRQRSTDDQAALRSNFREIMAFSRTEAALYRYQQLLRLLIGRAGPAVLLGLIALAVALSPSTQQDSSAPVHSPFAVEVHFMAPPEVLSSEGISAGCALAVARGVAVGGTIAEPEVVIIGMPSCPSAKIRITTDIGIARPLLP